MASIAVVGGLLPLGWLNMGQLIHDLYIYTLCEILSTLTSSFYVSAVGYYYPISLEKQPTNLQYVDSCDDRFPGAATALPTQSKRVPQQSRFIVLLDSDSNQVLSRSTIPFFGLWLGPAIQPGRLIRRLGPRPRRSSVRTEMIPFQSMLEHLFARLRRSGASCLCLPLLIIALPLLS